MLSTFQRLWVGVVLTLAVVCYHKLTLATEGADAAPAVRLMSFDALQKRLGDSKLRLLDCRSKEAYDAGHIPGAVWVDAKKIEKEAAKPGALTDRKLWQEWIEPLGISAETEVYAYDANRQLDAARIWWLLTYIGVEKAGLIDGNFPLWAKQERPTTKEASTVSPRQFPVKLREDRIAHRADVLELTKSKTARVLDARSDKEHTGEEKRSKRGGHIPAACHLEWAQLVDADGRFLDKEALRRKITGAGIKLNDSVVTHCQGGGRASVNAFALELLGIRARNYYLGWSDWGNAEDVPVNTIPKPTGPEAKKEP